MARKRLSDLLREEGQDPGDQSTSRTKAEPASKSGSEETIEVEPISVSEPSGSKIKDSKTKDSKTGDHLAVDALDAIEATVEVIAVEAERVEDFISDLRDAAVEPEIPDPFDVELDDSEATILQLQADLAAVQQSARLRETELQQEIEQLQTQTATQSEQIQALRAEMQQFEQLSDKLKTELESARQMILQLSEVNKPAAEPTGLMRSTSAARPAATRPTIEPALPRPLPASRAAEPELESAPARMVIPAASPAAERPKLHELELRKVLDHPVRPGALPPMPSDALTTRTSSSRSSLPPMSSDALTTRTHQSGSSLPPMSSEALVPRVKPPGKEMSLAEADVGWMD